MARSFRAGTPKTLITHGVDHCVVFGERRLDGGNTRALGVSRRLDGSVDVRIAGESVGALSRLADELPLLLINADSFDLLVGQPQQRRRFIDWGVFHVEHEFREHWQRFQRALSQRNHLLRRGRISTEDVAPWDRDLARHGEAISSGREQFLEGLRGNFATLMMALAPELGEIELRYRRGWDSALTYGEVLSRSLDSDMEQGFTQSGPQRADLKLSVGGNPVAATLSRGQQKLVVCALKLAQGQVLSGCRKEAGLFLVDDLPAELDAERCERVCRALARTGAQTFLTCVDAGAIKPHWLAEPDEVAVFHVEHGKVNRHDAGVA